MEHRPERDRSAIDKGKYYVFEEFYLVAKDMKYWIVARNRKRMNDHNLDQILIGKQVNGFKKLSKDKIFDSMNSEMNRRQMYKHLSKFWNVATVSTYALLRVCEDNSVQIGSYHRDQGLEVKDGFEAQDILKYMFPTPL